MPKLLTKSNYLPWLQCPRLLWVAKNNKERIPLKTYNNLIINNYFRYFLKNPYFLDYVDYLTYGVKMSRLGTIDSKMALFPLPPLTEQRRIIEKVGRLMNLRYLLGHSSLDFYTLQQSFLLLHHALIVEFLFFYVLSP